MTVTLASILLAISVLDLRQALNPDLLSSRQRLMSQLSRIRSNAISTTSALEVRGSENRVTVIRRAKCGSTVALETPSYLAFSLRGRSRFSNQFNLCFNSRGFVQSTSNISLTDGSSTKVLAVYLTGSMEEVS